MMNNLRALRQQSGLPLLGLAAKSKVSTATLSMIERFDYTPGPELRQRIAAVLGQTEDAIWPGVLQEAANGSVQR